MSRVYNVPSSFRDRKTILLNDQLDTLNLSLVHFTMPPPLATPFVGSFISGAGRLRFFTCDTVTECNNDGITRTTLYDSSGNPSGTEPVLYSFLSFSSQISNSTASFQNHEIYFPGNGLYYKNGVGIISQRVLGLPDIIGVDMKIYYQTLVS